MTSPMCIRLQILRMKSHLVDLIGKFQFFQKPDNSAGSGVGCEVKG
jgi:hypothetical protein